MTMQPSSMAWGEATGSRRLVAFALLLVAFARPMQATAESADARPNILWIIVDDMSANFSCYGEKLISTPNVDRLAREGTLFRNAFVTGPVCSASRSALITGMYQTTIGAHHHRSGRGELKITLPRDVQPVPVLFKRAGYYTCIGLGDSPGKQLGKTDYNFEWDRSMYDSNDWSGRKPGQPFFMQVQLHGGKHREIGKWKERATSALGTLTQADDVELPPYYPRDRVLLEDRAAYLDTCRYTDLQVGQILAKLEEEGILDETLVILTTDHGISHARGKQYLYDEGTHVPLVVRGPGIAAGHVREDLIEHIDLAAISLAAAGLEIPAKMQARNVFSDNYMPRSEVFAARDRCDETVEHLRSVRTDRWLYIRNYLPKRPHLQPNAYKDAKPILRKLRELHAAKQLNELQEGLLFADIRPEEELYEWTKDEHQLRNMAEDPAYGQTLVEMRSRLDRWIVESGDLGAQAEPEAMYDSDMAVYLKDVSGAGAEKQAEIAGNIRLMKKWAAEGK